MFHEKIASKHLPFTWNVTSLGMADVQQDVRTLLNHIKPLHKMNY